MSKVRSVCFGGESGTGACRYFRAEIPAKALRPLGWNTSVSAYVVAPVTDSELKQYGPRLRWDDAKRKRIGKPPDIMTLRIMDDVVLYEGAAYQMERMPDYILRAREAGQIVLYDIDDDLWHLPEWSPAAQAMNKMVPYARACDLDVVDANIRACDGVITSTDYLAEILRKRFEVPVYVIRPGIDPSVYLPRGPGPLRVGWMGSMSHHLPHLRTMQTALDCLPKYDAEFMRLGWIRGDRSEERLQELPCRVGQVPWGGIEELPQKLSLIDIGIIPRVLEDFNEGQSVTSGLQYAAAGIPFLVSPSAEYERLQWLGAGHVCRTINDWRQGLSDLLEFPDARRHESERARECVEAEFGLEATGRHYNDLFVELLDG
jgi:glycosyltransferase involved in cell wall biosynthesis